MTLNRTSVQRYYDEEVEDRRVRRIQDSCTFVDISLEAVAAAVVVVVEENYSEVD